MKAQLIATAAVLATLFIGTLPARADDCSVVLPLLRRGYSVVEISKQTGIPSARVAACQRASQARRWGAAGPPPVNAPGPPPAGAAGPPPVNAPGPAPQNPAGFGPGAIVE
jgi:hypothetical protein